MTSRDEALRALADWCNDRQVHWAAQDGDYAQGRVNAFCEAEYEIRQSLAAILSARQEVAPVVLARGFFHRNEQDEDGDYEIFGSKDDRCEKCIPCLIVTDSPAQTSEARDAALWRFCNGTHELENGEVAKMHVNVGVNVWRGEKWLAFHECSPDEAREIINGIAAMRQEAGDV